MEDADFRKFFQKFVDQHELSPDVAAELLQRILAILNKEDDIHLQFGSKYEILINNLEREELL